MKLETFFEKFDELADTPDGVKQLRELVLQLAVEGSLVPHSAAEPAVPYASVEDATPINVSDVPENWRVVLLADAIKNRSGNSKLIKGKLHEEPAPGRFQGFSASGADVWCDDYENEGQAIIISAVGARCGKAFKASGKWSAIANTNITRPEPTLFDFDFAYLVLNNEHFWIRGGSAQPFVKFPPSLDRHFALPPLAEQKRIVAKVDELMALCDRLEAQQQERETRHAALARASLARFADAPTPANLQFLFHPSYAIPPTDLRKSILTLAVQGKLVPKDPNDEPAEVLVARLKAELSGNSGGRRKGESLPEIAPEEIPFDLPNGWVWERLGAIGDTNIGLTYSPQDVSDSGIPVLRSSNIQNGKLDFADLVRVKCEPKQSVMVRDGDLLICARNGSRALVGKVAVIENLDEPAAFGAFMAIFRSGVNRYLYHFICSPLFRRMIDEVNTTTINQITQNNLRTTLAPIPPLAEQRRIVAKVEQLMALVDALEQQLAASRATAAKLLTALVAELTSHRQREALEASWLGS